MIRFLVINEPHEIKLAASPKIALSTCCRGAGRAQSIPEKIKLFLCLFSVSCVIFQKEFSFLPCVLSRCSHVQLFLTLWSIAHQAPLAMGFSKQEYWSGLPFPSPGIFPTQGLNPTSLASLGRRILYQLHYLGIILKCINISNQHTTRCIL